ncbi:MAG: MmgE/PrpD family protein [Anaerolineae bacterium]|jgi:2-methylcitrate dehydratase PrpD|nr:MmgE/PrpD family protein [Anaerolineae bacterium]MBT3712664.1 MmgE/PrpD family protein [Anaerolineae bacterium]MBT4309047.1 MmgE/PrpD family protein [Anaerolineae bacterium]MBT4460188.1 MmgE/PrpD family protein [Anaerolineae bacterium]MBT4840874.1 MmgE/PrpD family protein [Anaerolineae bacterium]
MKTRAPFLYQVAEFISSAKFTDFGADVIHQANRVIADTVGAAYSGVRTDAFQRALKSKNEIFGDGVFEIWGTDQSSVLSGAIFYNALAISSTDFDEGHRKAVGHPASLVVPTALVLGKSLGLPSLEIRKAVIIGYEVATRFSNARYKEKITNYASGRWGAIGTAATAVYLLGLDIEQTMHALSNASVLSPTMLGGTTDVSTGAMSKEGVAWATLTGLQSALLAKNGFVGPFLFVDEHDDYEKEKLVESWGETWLISSNYFKPYACCRWLHSTIDAGLTIIRENQIISEETDKVEIYIFERALKLVGNKYPENFVQAQFHLPYSLACALIYGDVLPICFSAEYLKKMEIRNLIDKIDIKPDDDYTALFPGELPSRVKIILKDGKAYLKEVLSAPWDAGAHPSDEELYQKFEKQVGEQGEVLWDQIFS